MPSIDVHAAVNLFTEKDERTLAVELAEAALRAEGMEPSPFLLSKAWVFFHRHPASAILAGDGSIAQHAVRVNILTPPGRLTPEARSVLVEKATRIVARVVGGLDQESQTFVIIAEADEGGWGLAGRTGTRLVEWAMERATADDEAAAG